jgi:hypothetical protein
VAVHYRKREDAAGAFARAYLNYNDIFLPFVSLRPGKLTAVITRVMRISAIAVRRIPRRSC